MILSRSFGSPIAAVATPRRARLALVGVHLPMICSLTLFCWTGLGVWSRDTHRFLDVVCALGLGLTQINLSLRIASGRAGRERFVLYAGVLVLALIPVLVHPDLRWLVSVWFLAAAGGMVFTGIGRAAGFVLPILLALLGVAVLSAETDGPYLTYYFAYSLIIYCVGAGCLLATTRVVQVAVELTTSRSELADLASRTERSRAGRDLHDTLGQRLSAISLKGDLAMALWPTQVDLAAHEVSEVAAIAARAAGELDDVARDEQQIDLADELARALELLRVAGVQTEVDDSRPALPPEVDRLLGWAVREASTNLLRHSAAAICQIRLRAGGPGVLLDVVNDGAGRASGRLGGLAGLAERAKALDGVVAAGRVGADIFRLRVAVPLEDR